MGALVGVLLFAVMAFALIDTWGTERIDFDNPEPIAYVPQLINAADIPSPVREALGINSDAGEVEISQGQFNSLLPEVQRRVPGAEVRGNTAQISDAIFSQYIIPFEAVSVLLLAALIGAVVVARKE